MSRSHFSHYFKSATGMSPANFVTQIRLEEASRRLIQSDQKLSVIAKETGFADANHFAKCSAGIITSVPARFASSCDSFIPARVRRSAAVLFSSVHHLVLHHLMHQFQRIAK